MPDELMQRVLDAAAEPLATPDFRDMVDRGRRRQLRSRLATGTVAVAALLVAVVLMRPTSLQAPVVGDSHIAGSSQQPSGDPENSVGTVQTHSSRVQTHVQFQVHLPDSPPRGWVEVGTVIIRRDFDADGRTDANWLETVWTPTGRSPGEGNFLQLRQSPDAGMPSNREGWQSITVGNRFDGWIASGDQVVWSMSPGSFYSLTSEGVLIDDLLALADEVATADRQ